MADLLQQLLPISWRGIGFPIASLTTEFDHDLAPHKSPDVDGARLEGTGRNVLVLSGHCIFRNGIFPGPNEDWTPGKLYPDAYRAFMQACADRTTGDLVHPSLGTLRCKIKSFKSSLTATARDGEDVDVTWMVTNEEDVEDALTGPSPLSSAISSATSLDLNLPAVAKANGLPDDTFGTFSDLLNSITAVSDSAQLLSKKMGASIDRQIARVQDLQEALSGLKGVAKANAVRDATRLESALYTVKETLLVSMQVHVFEAPKLTTLAALTGPLGTKITDLIKLNPDLVKLPMVPAQTAVRFYKAA